ncbi:MAG: hypothetical protein ACKVT0_15855 [Planctomycetaceae bacterium]
MSRSSDSAESVVESWGTIAGFTVTPVKRDRDGWDHQFEFSRQDGKVGEFGEIVKQFETKIQVKSTTKSVRSHTIKLSNCKKAVESVFPWFFLFLDLDPSTCDPKQVHLIHVDAALTERILKRLFELNRRGNKALNKCTLSIKNGDGVLLTPPYPESLKTHIYRCVGDDALEYAKQKHKWFELAGMEDATQHVKFTFQAATRDELYRKIARAAVGLDKSVEVFNVRGTTTRFGIEIDDARFNLGDSAKVSIGPSKDQNAATLIVNDSAQGKAVALRVRMRYSASAFPMLPEEFEIIRFESDLIDLVLEGRGKDARLTLRNLSDERTLTVGELRLSFAFVRILTEAQTDASSIEVQFNNIHASLGTIGPLTGLHPDVHRLLRLGCDFADFGKEVGVDDAIEVSIADIRRYGPAAQLLMAARRQIPCEDLRAEVRVPKKGLDLKLPATMLSPYFIPIGPLYYGELVCVRGNAEIIERLNDEIRLRIDVEDIRTVKSICVNRQQAKVFSWDKAFEEASEMLSAEGYVNIIHAVN